MKRKLCSKCQRTLPLSAFGKDRHRKSGITSHCRECRNRANRQYMAARPGLKKRINDAYRAYRKDYYSRPENQANLRNHHLRRRFGMTQEGYEALLKKQKGVCAICRRYRLPKNRVHLHVDHCHSTGRIRGVLCAWCNKAIGLLDDDEKLVLAAARYLRERGSK